MKFSRVQIEDFRHSLGITTEAAADAMQQVALMVAEKIREAMDPYGLVEGDSYSQGMERAASIADEDESPSNG